MTTLDLAETPVEVDVLDVRQAECMVLLERSPRGEGAGPLGAEESEVPVGQGIA
ncbi:MAG: hypothetical protein ABIU87_12095 [Ornithinibacter sp.]